MKVKALVKLLERSGWVLTRQRGSHRIFEKDGHSAIVVPGDPNRELAKGTEEAILKATGLKS